MDPSQWVDEYADSLFSFAFYKTGNREDAEDLVQETFLSAFNNRESFRGESSVKTWLSSILKNKITDYYRRQRPEILSVDALDAGGGLDDAFFDPQHFGAWKKPVDSNFISDSPENYLYGKEFREFLRLCLQKLPERLRRIFISKFLEEEKTEDICKENGITASNYWVLVFRAKVLLRECLEKRGINA